MKQKDTNLRVEYFKVGINTVQVWIKAEGKELDIISKEKLVFCDEMWIFVQKKLIKHEYGSIFQK